MGITPFDFYQLTPVELDWALKDFNETHFTPMKRICEINRVVAQVVYNSTPGRERKDMIKDSKRLFRFSWEEVKIQTVEEMKAMLLGLSHIKGTSIKQHGKKIDPFKDEVE